MAIARRLVGTNVSRANKTTNLLNADNHANFKRPSRPWPRSAGTINGINRPIQYPKQAISKSEVEYQLTGRGVASWRFVFISNNTTSCPGAVWRHIEGNVQIYTALRASSINFCSSNRHRHPYKYFLSKTTKRNVQSRLQVFDVWVHVCIIHHTVYDFKCSLLQRRATALWQRHIEAYRRSSSSSSISDKETIFKVSIDGLLLIFCFNGWHVCLLLATLKRTHRSRLWRLLLSTLWSKNSLFIISLYYV